MDAWLQIHRLIHWLGRLLVALALAGSGSAQAALEYVSPIETWCGDPWIRYTGLNDCGFPTKLAAAKATAAAFNVVYPPTKWTADSCESTINMYGDAMCSGTITNANGSVQTGNIWSVRINYDCPVPTVNPNITYYFNSTILMCQRPAQQSLTISLSGGTEVEPSNGTDKKFLPIIATIIDQSTNQPPTKPVKVHVSLKVEDPKSGGHDHGDSTRPRGGIAEVKTCASDGECWPGPQSTAGKGMTDGNGQVVFNFNAPEASGKYTITANCDGCGSSSPPKSVAVKVPDLIKIQSTPLLYTLIGAIEGKHTDNHYLTSSAVDIIWGIAADYHMSRTFWRPGARGSKKLVPPPPLGFNDASLIWGGKFDLSGEWKGNHYEHHKGVAIDIRANGEAGAVPETLFTSFVKLAAKQNAIAVLECTSNKVDGQGREPSKGCVGKNGSSDSNRHYHVRIN